MKKFINLSVAFAAALMLAACSSDEPGNGAPKDIPVSRSQMEALQTQNDFSFRLLGSVLEHVRLDNTKEDKSVVISPMNVSMDLCMIASGTNEDNAREIYDAFGFDGMTADDVAEANREIMRRLPSLDNKTKVNIANSVWVDSESGVYKSFTNQCAGQYGADIFKMKLSTVDCMNKMNSWCAKQTFGFIPNAFEIPLSPETKISFVNAVYFKGEWADKFDREDTKSEPFTNYDGTQKTVAMMHNSKCFAYREGAGAKAVTLEYGNGAYAMTLVLPDESLDIYDYIESFSMDKFNDMDVAVDKNGNKPLVKLGLPRFSVFIKEPMNGPISKLGISGIFSNGALDRIADSPVSVGGICQKALIEVNEEGTTAAAVTGNIYGANIEKLDIVNLTFDRPFFYWISERSTGAILFTGAVVNLDYVR